MNATRAWIVTAVETRTVQEFLTQLEADDPNVSLNGFIEAERSIGYRDRPMIVDDSGEFTMILDVESDFAKRAAFAAFAL